MTVTEIRASVLDCASPLALLCRTILHLATLIGETDENIYSLQTMAGTLNDLLKATSRSFYLTLRERP
jgi:hypothetical protein